MCGSFGSVTHALWAKGNLDIERSTPGSNSDDPAYVRQAGQLTASWGMCAGHWGSFSVYHAVAGHV